MTARDIMTKDVVTVGPGAEVDDVARLLIKHRVSALPVVDPDGELLGIVSEGDLIQRPEVAGEHPLSLLQLFFSNPAKRAGDYIKTHGRCVRDIMTKNVVTVQELSPIATIVRLLNENGFKRVPVMANDKLVGIVSRRDIIRVLAEETSSAEFRSDDDLLADLELVLDSQGLHTPLVSIMVKNGNFRLRGLVDDDATRRALKIAAENIPGAKGVVSELRPKVSYRLGFA